METVRKNVHLPFDVVKMITEYREMNNISTDTRAIIEMLRIASVRSDLFELVKLGHEKIEKELKGLTS